MIGNRTKSSRICQVFKFHFRHCPNFVRLKTKTPDNYLTIGDLCTQGRNRTGTALRPLVFETNASTNSATWAYTQTGCKYV